MQTAAFDAEVEYRTVVITTMKISKIYFSSPDHRTGLQSRKRCASGTGTVGETSDRKQGLALLRDKLIESAEEIVGARTDSASQDAGGHLARIRTPSTRWQKALSKAARRVSLSIAGTGGGLSTTQRRAPRTGSRVWNSLRKSGAESEVARKFFHAGERHQDHYQVHIFNMVSATPSTVKTARRVSRELAGRAGP